MTAAEGISSSVPNSKHVEPVVNNRMQVMLPIRYRLTAVTILAFFFAWVAVPPGICAGEFFGNCCCKRESICSKPCCAAKNAQRRYSTGTKIADSKTHDCNCSAAAPTPFLPNDSATQFTTDSFRVALDSPQTPDFAECLTVAVVSHSQYTCSLANPQSNCVLRI